MAKRKELKECKKLGVSVKDDDPDMELREVVMMDRDFTALR